MGFMGATYTITNTSTGETVANGPSDAGYGRILQMIIVCRAGCYEVNVTIGWDAYGYNWNLEMLVVQQVPQDLLM